MPRVSDPNRKGRGFTLVEVLVALAIVGLALPALLLLVQQQIEGTAHMRNKMYAQWVAGNQLTEQRLAYWRDGKLETGEDEGQEPMAGQTWYWHSATTRTADENYYRIEVSVGLTEKPGNRLVSLTGIVRAAR